MVEWIETVTKRLNSALPHHTQNQLWTPANEQLLQQTTSCVVDISTREFCSTLSSLGKLLQALIKANPPASSGSKEVHSYLTILDCLKKCLEECTNADLNDDDLNALRQLEQKITMLCLLQGEHVVEITHAANGVLYHLSGLQFHSIFNKIILRITSLNRGSTPSNTHLSFSALPGLYTHNTANGNVPSLPSGEQPGVIELIPYLNLNAARLQQILQVIITSFKELKNSKQKQLFYSLPPILHRSIWNFIQDYPDQYNGLLSNEFPSLERSAEKLFTLCDEYADNQRRKIQIWPLQNTFLILCPHILRDIAENGLDSPSPQYQLQRNFLTSIMKGLSNKQLSEAATICCIDHFKAGSFVKERSQSFFRFFISQIQGKLHSLLFSPTSLFLHQPSSAAAGAPTFSDLDLMITCVVAQFRTNHRNSHIFSVCLDPESPPAFRLAFVEGLCTVLKERNMSWWPKNNAMHMYGPSLREIFQQILPSLRRYDTTAPNLPADVRAYLQSPSSAASMLQAKKSSERKQLVEMITTYQLIRGIIKLFSLDPMLALVTPKSNHLQECLIFMTGLVGLVQHQSIPLLPVRAADVLLLLHQPQNIESWDPKDPMTAFWDISGQVTYSIALKLFSRKTSDPIQLLGWLRQILHHRTKFLRQHETEAALGTSCKILQQMYTMLETVLLLFLRHTSTEAVQISLSCFEYLVQEAEIIHNPIEGVTVPYASNLRSYRQLSKLSTQKLIGRAQQQKQNRAILKGLVHTPGSALAWEDTYSSWRVTRSLLLAYQRPKEDTPQTEYLSRLSTIRNKVTSTSNITKEPQLSEENLQSEMINWSNMTGFLCSLAGVSTKASTYPLFLLPGNGSDGPDLNASAPLPSASSPVRDPIAPVSLRVKRSSSYHGRPKSLHNPYIRSMAHHGETVPNLSRVSTNPGESTVIVHDDKKPSRGSQTEAFISELMLLLKCDNEALGVQLRETVKELISYELSPSVYPYLFQCIMSESSKVFGGDGAALFMENNTALIEQLVSIVQHVIDTKMEGALEYLGHVKMDDIVLNLIMYVDSLEPDEHTLTIRIKLCHLIDTLMTKSRDLSFRAEVQFRNQVAQFLVKWLRGEIYISENMSHEQNLLNELDLNVLRALSLVMSGLVLQSKLNIAHVFEEKEKLFLKYFDAFINLINALNSVDWSTLSALHKQPLLRHTASLREHVVTAMSNMLTANIDSGLTHAIGLGYHEDLNTRSSFIEVLTSILQQGAEFNSLADTALADRYDRMLELITTETVEGEFPVMMALVNSVPQESMDELAEVLVILFDYKNKLVPFLYTVFNAEVEALESGRLDTLFRGNSIACKVLSCSFKTFGLYYLQSVVRPLILTLMRSGDTDYEVDPARLADSTKLEQNRQNLLDLVSLFYETIQKSLPSLPLQLRTVCHVLYAVVVAHFPESSLDTVNSAIFLRFINPAIVSPQSYGLIPQGEVPNSTRRGLTFLSKVLQNLANHVLFRKEAHMVVFNDFLETNFEVSRQLALGMASMGPYIEGEAGEYIAFIKESYKHRIHSLLYSNQEKITAYSASIRMSPSSRQLFEDVNMLMAQLGAPTYRRKRVVPSQRNTTMSQLEDFLDSMANECDEKTLRGLKANEIFYQAGQSKLGNPVFYFIVRKFRGDQRRSSNQVFYHTLSLLKARTEKVFELVIDLTQSTLTNEPDLELLVKFAAYVPELTMCSIEAVYFYGSNLVFKQSASKLANVTRIFSHIKGTKRIVMVDSLSRFSEFIDSSVLDLPSDTLAFEEEGKMEFNNIRFLMFKQVPLQIPATLHICARGLVVSLVDKIKVFDIPTMLREIYHIKDIRDIFSEDKGSLVVKFADGQLLKLTSSDAETIVKEVSTIMSKWQNQQPSRYMSERKLEPKDVPGTFLNLALLNLGSTSASLRTSAYKLLSAVKDTFKLRIDRHLQWSHDLCIPINSSDFVVAVSRELAANEPHLTLEFLSEVAAGFQQYTPAMKQLCLMYISPWIRNLSRFFAVLNEPPTDQKKVTKLIDLLVALTISERDMYPLIQSYIWSMVGSEPELLKGVLDSFIRMGLREGPHSRKVEVLADTTVSLEQGTDGVVATEVIKKMLKMVALTSEKVTQHLDKHPYWQRLVVLSRFLLALSFNNKVNIKANLTDVIYVCILLMANGTVFMRATIDGILVNIIQSLASLPQVLANEEALKKLSLKLAEFSDPKFYMQFGLSHPASVSAYPHSRDNHTSSRHGASEDDLLSAGSVVMVTENLLDVVKSCEGLLPECNWMSRWQRLARRTSFHYNPALQSRSFLMLGVISQKAPTILITKTLSVLEETLARTDNDITLIEALVLCLARLVPLLDENTKLNQHLFWVAVGVLQFEDSSLFAAGLSLIEACIKRLVDIQIFESQNLAAVMEPARDLMEWPLSQMDRELGLSFSTSFHFALSGLLYKGFSHPLSTVHTRTQELLTTLFFVHSSEGSISTAPIVVNENNLAYLTALFPQSEIMREQLNNQRLNRLKSVTSLVLERAGPPRSHTILLSTGVIRHQKEQLLFLLTLASALIQSKDEAMWLLLYEFLANASEVYCEVFPLIHKVLVDHMTQMLQHCQNAQILKHVQHLVTSALSRTNNPPSISPSYINDIGFGGLSVFFRPFPKRGVVTPTSQGTLFQRFLTSLVQQLSPGEDSPTHTTNSLKGSVGKLSHSSSTYSASSIRDYYSYMPPPAPHVTRKSKTHPLGDSLSTASSLSSLQSTPQPPQVLRSESPDEGNPPFTQPSVTILHSESPERVRQADSAAELSMDELDTSDVEETDL